ncbi:hypothetical protein MPDQ_005168 [Monascus purpureus]|uniref:Mediator of RNA polymerase II transcription subunit 1 n=1 Tax=Monascus purpureus TaxID=5098 RepID=A0A507R104_MONPU|nr:hypothetical protein MPDQ_005168 [Monascus purpureus]
MATPSSKHHPGTTPTHLAASPHPSTVPMARPLSHKSPSTTRTPSASGAHVHNQQLGTSQQYATPLTVPTAIDDPVTFSSPSALLALGAYSGTTPSPAAHDGLVGPGMNENDIHALGMHGLKLGTSRDSDEERRRHIEEILQLLRSRISGRGVCREGVERLGQLEGFESIWQEDNLSIAGNFVDLEIEFYPGQDTVKDVSLKYATPEATEGQRREGATAVLRRDLVQSPEERERGQWKPMNGFHENLKWLAKLDRLSQEVNCFEAIEDLCASLKRIWEEESKHIKYTGDYGHLCSGSVGRPCLHKGGRIGFGLDYWVERASVLDAKQKRTSPDAMAIDQPSGQIHNEELEHQHRTWGVMIECEEGYPPLRISKNWVNSDVLTTVGSNEPSSSHETAQPEVTLVNWADPPSTLSSMNENQHDPMALGPGILGSPTPNRRLLDSQLPQDFKMVTYDSLLVPGWSPLSLTETTFEEFTQPTNKNGIAVNTFDSSGKPLTKRHSYSFQAFESVAGRTLHDIPFSHPRQLADIIPILRQYALLASFIQKIFNPADGSGTGKKNSGVTESKSPPGVQQTRKPKPLNNQSRLTILSNDDPNEDKLNSLLTSSKDSEAHNAGRDVKIDITLRTQLGQAPVIMLLFTAPDDDSTGDKSTMDTKLLWLDVISVSFEIRLNGRISIVDTAGLGEEELSAGGETPETEDNGASRREVLEMRKKMERVLEISQDLGILVEWVLRWLRQRKRSG